MCVCTHSCVLMCALYANMCVCAQSGLDIMHTADLGLWVHILNCIAWKYDKTLKRYRVLPTAKVTGVWNKLEKRALDLNSDDCMLKMNWYKANYLKFLLYEKLHPENKKKAKVQAWEHHLLMNVSICSLCCMYIVCVLTCVQVCCAHLCWCVPMCVDVHTSVLHVCLCVCSYMLVCVDVC